MNMTIVMGPRYVYHRLQTIYTLAPHGTVLCKLIGGESWIPSAMSKEEFEEHIKSGALVRD